MYPSGGDAENGEGYENVGTEIIWEISVSCAQFCCEPKKSLLKKKNSDGYKRITINGMTYPSEKQSGGDFKVMSLLMVSHINQMQNCGPYDKALRQEDL